MTTHPAETSDERPHRRGRTRRVTGLLAGLIILAIVAGIAFAVVSAEDAGARYRTATATTTQVGDTLDSVATIEPVSQAAVGFPRAGTVDDVVVEVGDVVEVGQDLATLDEDDLRDDLAAKQAALDEAELTLQRALDGEDVSGQGAVTSVPAATRNDALANVVLTAVDSAATPRPGAAGGGDAPTGDGGDGSDGSDGQSDASDLEKAQQELLAAQREVAAASARAQAALENAYAACGAVGVPTDDTTSEADAPDRERTGSAKQGPDDAPAGTPEDEPDDAPMSTQSGTPSAADDPGGDEPAAAPEPTDTAPEAAGAPSSGASETPSDGASSHSTAAAGTGGVVFTSATATYAAITQVSTADACLDALSAAAAAQQDVTQAQAKLTDAAAKLDRLVSDIIDGLDGGSEAPGDGSEPPGGKPPGTVQPGDGGAVPGGQPPSPGGAGGAPNGGQQPGGQPPAQGGTGAPSGQMPGVGDGAPPDGATGAPPDGQAGSTSPSSADLIAYQKAVDAAEAEVAVAEQVLEQATLISPIDGRVVAVTVAAGDVVSTDDEEAAITIEGDGGYELTTSVPVDALPDIEPGQTVDIVPDGADDALRGQVVGVGVTGTDEGAAMTYPVTIAVVDADRVDTLRNGSLASVGIVTDEASEVTAVPTSAVTNTNGVTTVDVVTDDGTVSTVTVQVGVIGDTWTEITDGLEPGDIIVLADLDAELPSSATDASSQGGGPTGGFPGGGPFPGGGFPGGGGGFPGGGPPG